MGIINDPHQTLIPAVYIVFIDFHWKVKKGGNGAVFKSAVYTADWFVLKVTSKSAVYKQERF